MPRLPSEYPFPLRLSPWEAFRFNANVRRAALRARHHELREGLSKIDKDEFGIGTITALLGGIHVGR